MVKVTVLAIEPATGRLKLGLAGKKATAAAAANDSALSPGGDAASSALPYGGMEPGDLAEAVVKQV